MYDTILVPIDLDSPESYSLVLPRAVEAARNCGGRLVLLTVVPDDYARFAQIYTEEDLGAKLRAHAKEDLDKLIEERVPKDVTVRELVYSGRPARTILRVAEDLPADLIVMAPHDPGSTTFRLGSVTEKVVRHAPCTMMIMRDRQVGD